MNLSEANLLSHQERVTRWRLNMTLDLFIGFEQEPTGLEDFMKQQGYTSIEKKKDGSGDYLIFERTDNPWPCMFYSPHVQKTEDSEDVPNWRRAGFSVVSEANVNFNPENFEEADRLTQSLVNKFNGVLYDPDTDEYNGVLYDPDID